jgi:hypothetical protein
MLDLTELRHCEPTQTPRGLTETKTLSGGLQTCWLVLRLPHGGNSANELDRDGAKHLQGVFSFRKCVEGLRICVGETPNGMVSLKFNHGSHVLAVASMLMPGICL